MKGLWAMEVKKQPFHKVLVANRGDVSRRVIKTLREMGIRSVAVYSEADANLPYLDEADETYLIGEGPPQKSYLNQEKIIEIIKKTDANGIHPGYGFLSENFEFAAKVENLGVKFIGPSSRWIEAMSHKSNARSLMEQHGMSTGAGSGILNDNEDSIMKEANNIGFPVLVKPVAGGGGIGMLAAYDESGLLEAVKRSRSLASRSFSNNDIYLEKYLEEPRHIEFQIIADQHGNVRHLFERDCSIQRRHQKVIEEAIAPFIDHNEKEQLANQIIQVLKNIGYDNIGTVEMLRGKDGSYSFLEMNTRLQVEHAVTEEIVGIDLVKAQIQSAYGDKLQNILPNVIHRNGHAIEARIYAEDPVRFFPSPGKLKTFRPPYHTGVRIDTGYSEGCDVTPFYDPMIAKVIVHEATRESAIEKLIESLKEFDISGVKTNIPFIIQVLSSQEFKTGSIHTGLASKLLSYK
jgi:acetyl-CoA carboxylase, biotin carboxylase subunit